MRCTRCGEEVLIQERFCAHCGAPSPRMRVAAPAAPMAPPALPPTPPAPAPLPPPVAAVWPAPAVLAGGDEELPGQAAPADRSFRGPALITLLLYFVFWLPGLIANLRFWRAARRVEQQTGVAPAGKGCLLALLVVGGLGGLLALVVGLAYLA